MAQLIIDIPDWLAEILGTARMQSETVKVNCQHGEFTIDDVGGLELSLYRNRESWRFVNSPVPEQPPVVVRSRPELTVAATLPVNSTDTADSKPPVKFAELSFNQQERIVLTVLRPLEARGFERLDEVLTVLSGEGYSTTTATLHRVLNRLFTSGQLTRYRAGGKSHYKVLSTVVPTPEKEVVPDAREVLEDIYGQREPTFAEEFGHDTPNNWEDMPLEDYYKVLS